jgi:protein-S-isoprenylcysteine O-methyltransferase Ste14
MTSNPSALGHWFSTHRILASRGVALIFFAVLVSVESLQEGRMTSAVLFLVGLALAAVATAGRLWCSLYISGYKDRALVVEGPYSMSRNPLYFFSMLGFVGIGFASETFTLGIGAAVFFLVAYRFVIAREERELTRLFGEQFAAYCRTTPRFFPDPRLLREPASYVVDPRRFRRSMGDVLWFVWLIGIVELVEALHEYHIVEPLIHLP